MRHAEVAYFSEPETGIEQALAAGKALAGVELDRVITSGVARTAETARLVVGQLHTPPARREIEEWPDLEDIQVGPLSEIPDEKLEEGFLSAFRGMAPREAVFLGGESVGALVDRVSAAMDRLYSSRDWHTILLVLHAGTNRAILSRALGGTGTFFGQLEQSPACINIIDSDPDFVVRAVNITPYDPLHTGSRATTLEDMLAQYRTFRQGPCNSLPPAARQCTPRLE
jgi:broad specificity phosphatase PhoE